jgi:hypothetical protein
LFYNPKISVNPLGNNGWVQEGTHRYELSEILNFDAIIVVFAGSDLDQELQSTSGSQKTRFSMPRVDLLSVFTLGAGSAFDRC